MTRRTLEYAFRDRFGISPKAFVKSERLTRVRRELLLRPDEVPIADIAKRCGATTDTSCDKWRASVCAESGSIDT
jgi:transcriptional regulator GlxA family with amidase domain